MFKLGLCSLFLFFASVSCYPQSPAFITKTPISGAMGNEFMVVLPILNNGTVDATQVVVSSITLGTVNAVSPAFPSPRGTLMSANQDTVVAHFPLASLGVGTRYLLTVRGSYKVGTSTLGFALNRFLTVTNTSGPVENELNHWNTIDSVEHFLNTLPPVDPGTERQELLHLIALLPGVVDSGSNTESSSVWAIFSDGRGIVIAEDVVFDSPTSQSQPLPQRLALLENIRAVPNSSAHFSTKRIQSAAGATPNELPSSSAARVLNALGAGSEHLIGTNNIISWLKLSNYSPVGSASILALKSGVANDGIFYISSHGGVSGDGNSFPFDYFLWTSSRETADLNNTLDDDIHGTNGVPVTTITFVAKESIDFDSGRGIFKAHYGINAAFVKRYFGDFGPNSLVYIDACASSSPLSRPFVDAFLGKKASVYVGWAGPNAEQISDAISTSTAKFVFDRLLGANKFCPENLTSCHDGHASPPFFEQRPFDYVSTQTDLVQHSLGQDHDLFLQFTPGTASFGLLAPSIGNMAVDETKGNNGQLTINGIFGGDADLTGKVEIGGKEANLESWDANKIVVNLDSDSSGDVVVTNRNHKSNVARITDWRSDGFHYSVVEGGKLEVQTIYNIHFRADIRRYRPVIHEEPVEPSGSIFAISDSVANFICGGSVKLGDQTFSLSGQGTYPAFTIQKGQAANVFEFAGTFINSHSKMSFGLGTTGVSGCSCTVCDQLGCFSQAHFIFGPSNPPVGAGPFFFTFNLDNTSAAIASGRPPNSAPSNLCLTDGTGIGAFTWDAITPTFAPDPESAR
jgi:hypothetical protein